MRTNNIKPPSSAQRLLLRFLREDLVEEVMGDLDEKFAVELQKGKVSRAKLHYWFQVIHYLRPFALRKRNGRHLNQPAMLKNYVKIGWRQMVRQKMYSAIKVGGFALGIAASLLIALFIRDELSYDLQYPEGNRIYRVYNSFEEKGEVSSGVWFQAPFAAALKENFPEIEKAGRYNSSELFGAGNNQIRRDDQPDNTFEGGFVWMDQELIELLEIPMIYGSREHSLDEPHTIVLTKRKADKYFPGEDPVGKLMVVNNDVKQPFKIGGVIPDFPANSHLDFDFIMTMKGVEFWGGEQNYWGATNYPTYVLLREGTNVQDLEKKMHVIIEKYMLPLWRDQGVANAEDFIDKGSFGLQLVKDIHLKSATIQDPVSHGDIRFVWLFAAVAVFIIIIACINFINLSTAKSANRAKEVGLRKTVGSHRSNIISQFLIESLIFSVLSFGIGLLLAFLLLPYFNTLAGKSLSFPWNEWWLFPLIGISSIVIGLIAGLYPAFYLSSFKPVDILKGRLRRGSKNSTMRSTLVIFQFTTSIILIIATFIIYRQMEYIMTSKVGFERDQVLLIQGTGTLNEQVKTLKNELLQLSAVKSASVSDYLPIMGTKRNGNGFYLEGRSKIDQSVGGQNWVVDEDYIPTLGMKIVEGRNFSRDLHSDSAVVIINQKMAKELGLTDPVGKRIQNWETFTVIGVVEDFHSQSLRSKIEPLVMRYGNSPGIISVKLSTTDMGGTLASIEEIWKKISPHQPIRYTFLDESFTRMYDDVLRMGRIFTTFALLAIVVACLGLFALSAFMVEQRGKEVSIRIILGASLRSIFRLLTLNFVKLVVISIVIATPISIYIMREWLKDFEYKTEITWDVFALAGGMAIFIALSTISYQALRAALMNPVGNLRSE